jgi:hypothetical protein
MSARSGWAAAQAALNAAGDRGLPRQLLIQIAAHVGEVSWETADQTFPLLMRSGHVTGETGRGRWGMTKESVVVYPGRQRPRGPWSTRVRTV